MEAPYPPSRLLGKKTAEITLQDHKTASLQFNFRTTWSFNKIDIHEHEENFPLP
jgi:hypothetical protein